VPMKDSGVEWLGEVPEHWEVARLRNVTKSATSGSRGWSSYASDEGPLFIRIANLDRMSLNLRFDNVVRLNLPETSETIRTRIHGGDLLISITAYIGSIAVVPDNFEEAYVSQHVARCPMKDSRHNPRWLGYVLLSEVGQTHGQLSLYGGTKDGLSLDDVKNYPIFLPPRGEQDQLVGEIEREFGNIKTSIEKNNHKIELLNEYRTRLIADVVTGKVDVREAAASLPDEPEELLETGEEIPEDGETLTEEGAA
jgi:type I restriction enzyme, S subunit